MYCADVLRSYEGVSVYAVLYWGVMRGQCTYCADVLRSYEGVSVLYGCTGEL